VRSVYHVRRKKKRKRKSKEGRASIRREIEALSNRDVTKLPDSSVNASFPIFVVLPVSLNLPETGLV
jgi:hypothetical protein